MKKYNVMVAKPYFDKQSNSTKTKWVKIGTAVEMAGNDGQMKTFGDIDATPTGIWWDGSFQLFEQDNQQQNQPSSQGQQNGQGQQQNNYTQQQSYNQNQPR